MDKDFRRLGKLSVCLMGAFWYDLGQFATEKGTRKAHREIYAKARGKIGEIGKVREVL